MTLRIQDMLKERCWQTGVRKKKTYFPDKTSCQLGGFTVESEGIRPLSKITVKFDKLLIGAVLRIWIEPQDSG